MASEDNLDTKKGFKLRWKSATVGVLGFIILFAVFVIVFGTPGSDTVFKDMKSKMLQTKSVTVEQSMKMSGDAMNGEVSTKMYLDMSSASSANMSGNFTMTVENEGIPITIAGDIVKKGDNNFVKYSEISSTSEDYASTFESYQSKLEGHWIKSRSSDQLESFVTGPIDFTLNIIPTPYANLNDKQRDDVLKTLNDSKMYTIEESSKVDISGVAAYKYQLKYDHDLYLKVAKLIHEYQEYLKSDSTDDNNSEITGMTVWVNINTRQIIKIEYTGTSDDGDVTGKMTFSGYGESRSVSEPDNYSIESELLE